MQSQVENERSRLRTNRIVTDRPDSSQHVDLHVYIIPKKTWKNRQNLAENEAIEQAISAGFVRVPQTLTISDLREHIINVCGDENDFPKDFIYLRSVGRCLTKVKHQQETELKVKNYRPPMTFAPEIFIIDGNYADDDSSIKDYLSIPRPSISSDIWIKPFEGPPLSYPLFAHTNGRYNSTVVSSNTNHSTSLNKLSPRDLKKSREEQDRLRSRQIELARKRHEIEEKQRLEDQFNKEKEAASKIQAAYRGYRDRQNLKEQQEADVIEIERLRKEARALTLRKAEEEHVEEREAHDVVRLSHRLKELKTKRVELEANREIIVRRMQQLHTQITFRRKEEKDLWKQKYFIEKNQTAALEEQTRRPSVKNQTDIHTQLDQAKVRLKHATKLRQQSEYESRRLRQELQQIRSSMNTLERHRLPKDSLQQQHQPIDPISLDITLHY